MAYNYLNESVKKFFSSATGTGSFMFTRTPEYSGFKAVLPVELSGKTEEILSHDFETFSKLIGFLNGSLNTFVLHGFMGSGKSAMINLIPKLIDSSVLYFRVNCFDSTNLDDVLLSLHTDFVNYHNEKRIVLPKVDSNGFTDRINAYIKTGNSPMLFVFDSLDSERCPLHGEILNFIKHISQIEKIKVVVTSRNLAADDLPNDSSTNFAIIKLCGKDEFISILNSYEIESDEETYEQVFVASKGHYLYISLIVNVIKLLNISLKSLYNDYSKKNMTIFDFLISKVLTLIPERFFKTLWFLALIRTGVSENFLITQKLSSRDELDYLEERMLLCRDGANIYLKDYVKHTVDDTINPQTRHDIHKYLHELYESQLPKKPSERDLVISRSTMRRESAYHKEAAENVVVEPVKTQPVQKSNIDYNYLSYSNSIKQDWNFANSTIAPKQQQRFVKPAPRGMETRIKNNLRAREFELSGEELKLLNQMNMKVPKAELVRPNKITDINPNNFTIRQTPIREVNKIETPQQEYQEAELPRRRLEPEKNTEAVVSEEKVETLASVMQEASQAEQEFNYEKALAIYGKAYSMTEEAGYIEAKPIIMMQTALCHRRMKNNDEALNCFDFAYKLYEKLNPQKANDALYNMAEIYAETYNHTQAKTVYEKILLSDKDLDLTFKTKVLLNLAELENTNSNIDKAYEYYNNVLNNATHLDDKKLICESCFKYALACDDNGDIDKAFKLYLRCVQTSSDYEINTFVSSAYSNMAGIYEEQGYDDKAVRYYEEAAKADEYQGNWDGMYFVNSKLAILNQSRSVNKALEYSLKALEAAKQLNDSGYIASMYTQSGDYCYQINNFEDALKYYLSAKSYMLNQASSDNIRKIDIRINNIKSKISSDIFMKINSEIGMPDE